MFFFVINFGHPHFCFCFFASFQPFGFPFCMLPGGHYHEITKLSKAINFPQSSRPEKTHHLQLPKMCEDHTTHTYSHST